MSETIRDVRWVQRLDNFSSALSQLAGARDLSRQRELTDLEKHGAIQAFEFTHELAWNLLKDYFEFQGTMGIAGSRDAAREAFRRGIVTDGDIWMEMIQSRNKTSHTYNKSVANEIVAKALAPYLDAFESLQTKMLTLKNSGAT